MRAPVEKPSKSGGSQQSIWFRLIVGLVGVSLLAAVATSFIIYERFVATNSAFRDRTLQNDARVISKLLRRAAEGGPLQLPDFLADGFQQGKGKYAVISQLGVLVTGSPGVTGPLAPIGSAEERQFFLTDATKDGQGLYGFTLKGTYGSQPVWIQVALPQGDIVFDSVLEEFVKDIGWIWLPFVILLLVTNLLVARVGLQPLKRAAEQAEKIGPEAVSARLPEDGLPREVYSLVGAVNRALDRLEVAFQSQRRFIADAAHELRTPVAVLRAHAAVLPPGDRYATWKEEIDAIDRLVNQLLDSARLDVIKLEQGETVELNHVAQTVAEQMAPLAIKAGKSVEVFPANSPIPIKGSFELLACAVRNLVENAIRHTPVGTAASIEILQPATLRVSDHGPGVKPEERELIFKRFWQGNRDRGGAGLGMDIVARSVGALGGSVVVGDAPTGGAVFTLRFPSVVGQ
jgi:signal transduction histidine kinase